MKKYTLIFLLFLFIGISNKLFAHSATYSTNNTIFTLSGWTDNGETNIYGIQISHFEVIANGSYTQHIQRTVTDISSNALPSTISSTPVYWIENINCTDGVNNAYNSLVGNTVLCWQNTFLNTGGVCRIAFRDTAMYTYGESVALTSADNSAIHVMTVITGVCQTVYSGTSPALLTSLSVGHYFVENSNDRCQFVVLPVGWSSASWFGLDALANVDWSSTIGRVYTQLNPHTWRSIADDSLLYLRPNIGTIMEGTDSASGTDNNELHDIFGKILNGQTNTWMREQIVGWRSIETSPGFYNFNNTSITTDFFYGAMICRSFDNWLDQNIITNIPNVLPGGSYLTNCAQPKIMFNIIQPPSWLIYTNCTQAQYINAETNLVKAILTHEISKYGHDYITWIEPVNEPYDGIGSNVLPGCTTVSNTAWFVAQICQYVRRAIHDIDSNVGVGAPSLSSPYDNTFMMYFSLAGGFTNIDVVTYHDYRMSGTWSGNGGYSPSGNYSYPYFMTNLASCVDNFNYWSGGLPIFASELGLGDPTDVVAYVDIAMQKGIAGLSPTYFLGAQSNDISGNILYYLTGYWSYSNDVPALNGQAYISEMNLVNPGTVYGSNPTNWSWDSQTGGQDVTNHIPSGANYDTCMFQLPLYYSTNSTFTWSMWTNYVGSVMTRYNPLAVSNNLYIEIWNEPWIDTWMGANGTWGELPFNHSGCVVVTNGYSDINNSPPCEIAYTNYLNAYCDLVATAAQVRASLGSNAKLVGPSSQSIVDSYDLGMMLANRGLTNIMSAISFHDGGINVLPTDFPDEPYNLYSGQTTISQISHLRSLVGTNMVIQVNETEYTARSAITDQPDMRQSNSYYNDGQVDWRTASNRVLKRGLIFLANNANLWLQHQFYAQPGGDFTIEINGWEGYRGITPRASATLMLNNLLKNYNVTVITTNNRQCVVTCVSTNSGVAPYRTFMWAHEGETYPLLLPAGCILKDIFGNNMSQRILTDEVGYYDQYQTKNRSFIAVGGSNPIIQTPKF